MNELERKIINCLHLQRFQGKQKWMARSFDVEMDENVEIISIMV